MSKSESEECMEAAREQLAGLRICAGIMLGLLVLAVAAVAGMCGGLVYLACRCVPGLEPVMEGIGWTIVALCVAAACVRCWRACRA